MGEFKKGMSCNLTSVWVQYTAIGGQKCVMCFCMFLKIKHTKHSLSLGKASRNNPHPIFSNCMQNHIMSVCFCLTTFLKKPIVNYSNLFTYRWSIVCANYLIYFHCHTNTTYPPSLHTPSLPDQIQMLNPRFIA